MLGENVMICRDSLNIDRAMKRVFNGVLCKQTIQILDMLSRREFTIKIKIMMQRVLFNMPINEENKLEMLKCGTQVYLRNCIWS